MEAEDGIRKKPWLLKRLRKIKSRIYTRVGRLESRFTKAEEPIPFEELGARKFRRVRPGQIWGKAFNCAWFRFRGTIPQNAAGQHVVLIVDIGGEGIYVDEHNEPLAGITDKMCWVDQVQSTDGKILIDYLNRCNGGEKIDILIDGSFNGKILQPYFWAVFKRADIAVCRDDIRDFYYDYLTASFLSVAAEDAGKEKEITECIDKAYSMLKDYSTEEIRNAKETLRAVLDKQGTEKELDLTAIGHSHLDLAWLWPVRETRRKAVRTFTNALNNIDRYPQYIYGASQPQQFEWMKTEQPALYERLKGAVNNGRIELQGGMWVECDTNITGGESLVRQILYGKEFFNAEFGKDMRMCWLPDVFGYSANLPQILRKTGLEYFMTIKLSWNRQNEFPHKTFNWEGIDGSSVLVHMPPEGDYNSGGTPLCVKRAKDQFNEKDKLDEALLVFGAGDGGGGPGEVHLELLKRQGNIEGFSRVRFGTAIDFFDRLKTKKDRLSSYRGELYLETHQGTYTTQGRNKWNNRKIEYMLHDLEMLASAAYLKGFHYPTELLERVWKEVLLYQFHDIIPGSSVNRVYKECSERYGIMMGQIKEETDRILGMLASAERKAWSGGEGPEAGDEAGAGAILSMVNTTAFPRSEYIKYGDVWYKGEAAPFSAGKLQRFEKSDGLAYQGDRIENEKLAVVFSSKGEIISLVDKESGKEFCGSYMNKLVLYTDKWTWFNAWDIDINYTRKRKTRLALVKAETFIDGPRVVRRNHYAHGKTRMVQDVILTSESEYVEFDTWCDYHELFKMLRADFEPSVYNDKVKCDIQFGSFDRSTREDTPIEKAQFEICAHKWVDVSDDSYGLSLLNDCKYGHRVKNGLISLNLLRSPVYPDPKADRGEHRFRYALYPHTGTAFNSSLIRHGYHFNIQPLVYSGEVRIAPMFSADHNGIILETVKKAEKGNGIVLRAYEAYGKKTDIKISTSVEYKACFLADMLETPIGTAVLEKLGFEPFETKTILLEL